MHRTNLPSFDMLVSLHQQDAESFEAFRKHLLQEAVESAPVAKRDSLRRLLKRIEAARAEASSPIESAKIAFDMMVESMHDLSNGWQQAHSAIAELQAGLAIEKIRQQVQS